MNPFFELQTYMDMSPLVILDPSFYMIKNVAINSHRIGEIQNQFSQAYEALKHLEKRFMDELQTQIKTEVGVKKDYFLNYFRKKSRVLQSETEIFSKLLGIGHPTESKSREREQEGDKEDMEMK